MTKRISIFCLSISILSLIGHLFVFPMLPEVIPIHWDTVGEPDGFAGKYMALVLAAIPLFLWLLFLVFPKIDPRKIDFVKNKKSFSVFTVAVTLLFVVVSWTSTLNGIGILIPVETVVPSAVIALVLVMVIFRP